MAERIIRRTQRRQQAGRRPQPRFTSSGAPEFDPRIAGPIDRERMKSRERTGEAKGAVRQGKRFVGEERTKAGRRSAVRRRFL